MAIPDELNGKREDVGAVQHNVVTAIGTVRPLVFRQVERIGRGAPEDAPVVVRCRFGERIGHSSVPVPPSVLRLREQCVVARGPDVLQGEDAGEPLILG